MLTALNRLQSKARELSREVPEKAATGFVFLIINNVHTEKFGLFGKSYSERYKEWKQVKVGSLKPFVLYGEFLKSLGVYKISDNMVFGGIIPGALGKRGESVEKYMQINEMKRPLFAATRTEYIGKFWPQLGKDALSKLRQQWR